MAYEPLHHKYRPQTFADLVGQEAIATTLTNAILQSRIAPAYLFTGPRGTGKTSSARILAKSLNCQSGETPTPTPCGTCEACRSIVSGSALDVIEIDAASNTGVDNIRELIEKAQFAPVQCRFKVYVVDECHMLSTAAFNALLKTLEEPPDRVVFVLATTDPQRVLPTIISRCQRFDYRRIPLESMVSHLRFIADQENIEIEQDALTLVAQIAQGGLRDAESLLDQLSLLPPPIKVEAVWDLVGAVPERDLLALAEAIAKNHPEGIIDRARHLMNRGREPLIVLQNLASFYRDLLIAKTAPQRHDLVAITPSTWEAITAFVKSIPLTTLLQGQEHLRASEVQLKNTTQPRLWLEVTLLGLLPGAQMAAPAPAATPMPAIAAPTAAPAVTTPTSAAPAPPPTQAPMPPAPEPPGMVQQASAALGASPLPSNTPQENTTNHVNLKELWKRIVANVEFRSTQMLLRQQGRLLKVTDKAARVGINERWISNLQGKLPAIEAAFAKTMGQPLKVSLESVVPQSEAEEDISAPTIPLTPAAGATPTSTPTPTPAVSPSPPSIVPPPAASHPSAPIAPPITPPVTTALPIAPPSPQVTPGQTATPPPTANHSAAPVPAPSLSEPPPTAAPSPSPEPTPSSAALLPIGSLPSPQTAPSAREAMAEPAPVGQLLPNTPAPGTQAPGLADWDEGELLRAAKSLAQFFNGEVVPLDGTVESITDAAAPDSDSSPQQPQSNAPIVTQAVPTTTTTAVAPVPTSLPQEEDDDDVPF